MCVGKKKSLSKLRRRKALDLPPSDDESDLSDNQLAADYSSSDDSFISDNEDVLVESSDDDLDIIKVGKTVKTLTC